MRKVLVIEDDVVIALLLEEQLAKEGFRVRSVTDPLEFFKYIELWQPQVIVLDIMMPKISGWEVLQQLKANEKTKGIKVYMLTALSLMEDVERALQMGAEGYFVKPVKMNVLASKLWA